MTKPKHVRRTLLARSRRCAIVTEQYAGLDQYLRKQRYRKRNPKRAPEESAVLFAEIEAAHRREPGLLQRELAVQFGVCQSVVSSLLRKGAK